MIKVAAITSGRNEPSTRFRVRQHIQPLTEWDIHVTEYIPLITKTEPVPFLPSDASPAFRRPLSAIWSAIKLSTRLPGLISSYTRHVTWLEREMLPGHFTFERWLHQPLVFDVDDALWLLPWRFAKKTIQATAHRANIVIAGNTYLADWFSHHTDQIRIIPTAVDTERFVPAAEPPDREEFIIGWTGTAGNLPYLYAIEEPLAVFLQDHPVARLHIICDIEPEFTQIQPYQIKFVRWSPEQEVRGVQQMSVGLMPLPDTPWTQGKCSFKMLQYMSCAVPVIVSPIGINAEVLAHGDSGFAAHQLDDWYDALATLCTDRSHAHQMGQQGRMIVEKHYSREAITPLIASVFKEVI
jgi:glycosyltransferase involved in cell wall biosynthesis